MSGADETTKKGVRAFLAGFKAPVRVKGLVEVDDTTG
jgi:hypothetical protein